MPRFDLRDLRAGRLSAIVLVAANLVPLFGVLSFGWDLTHVLFLFWAENAIIGAYSLLRMGLRSGLGIVVTGPFFVFHYGAFMLGHLLFLSFLFFDVDLFARPEALLDVIASDRRWFVVALASLIASHGVSFWQHFVRGGERVGESPMAEMGRAYLRVMILHVVIIAGALPARALGQPLWALFLLVALKTGVDVAAHAASHREKQRTKPPTGEPAAA